jgi:hypothetical protein
MTSQMSRTRWIWWACTGGEVEKGEDEVETEIATTPGSLGPATIGMEEARQREKKNMVI